MKTDAAIVRPNARTATAASSAQLTGGSPNRPASACATSLRFAQKEMDSTVEPVEPVEGVVFKRSRIIECEVLLQSVNAKAEREEREALFLYVFR